MTEILLATETSRSRAPQLNNEHLLNWMTEKQPSGAKGQTPLFGCPGILRFGSAGNQPSRGACMFGQHAMFVQGTSLYEIRANGNEILWGENIGGSNPVGMASNGLQLMIVNGVKGWTFDFTNGLAVVTDPNFQPARTVTFLDNYFLFDHRDTRQWFISALLDGRTYSGLDFASAEGGQGNVVAVRENLQFIFVFCTDHIELWYDAGAASFPFQRYTGGIINYGCVAPYSIVRTDGALFFLGTDNIFYRLQGNVAIRISTHPIERLIAAEPNPEHAECITFTVQGHKLIFVTLPSQSVTLCYDVSTERWHERDSVDALFISLGRYRARTALEAYGKILVGDAYDGRIGSINWDWFKEYDLPMRGIIDTITQHSDRNRLFCSRFELDMETGVGLTRGQGSEPQIMLRKTVDGGKTYGPQQPWRTMGKQGEFTQRLRWLRQGMARQMGWRLEITDPVRWTIIAAHADISPGYN